MKPNHFHFSPHGSVPVFRPHEAGQGPRRTPPGGWNGLVAAVLIVFAACSVPSPARADTFSGRDWIVRFNLPDQTTSPTTIGQDEHILRDAWLARINALQKGDWACLSTYTFSGPSASSGAAGPILGAVSNALARGASVGFVVDADVDIASNFWSGCSLQSLASLPVNPLHLSQDPSTNGIMHDKLGVFHYAAANEQWVLSGSWNYTGGASSQQWNILAEIRNAELATAVSNELSQMLAGVFHSNIAKSHSPDNVRFRLDGSPSDSWVRFAPYPDKKTGGNNAVRDITNAIAHATGEIYFSLNKLTVREITDQLIRACNRGVAVHGVIPKSSLYPTVLGTSYHMYTNLLESASYTTTNKAHLYEAYYSGERDPTHYDSGSRDLVHTKYMVIDPFGANPMVIHGSANWTAAALREDKSNDENVLFLPHRGIAFAFAAHFATETDGLVLDPVIQSIVPGKSTLNLSFWIPHLPAGERPKSLVHSPTLVNPVWKPVKTLSTNAGNQTISISATNGFFRLQ